VTCGHLYENMASKVQSFVGPPQQRDGENPIKPEIAVSKASLPRHPTSAGNRFRLRVPVGSPT